MGLIMDEVINKLCEKFGVTANYLVDELCRYYTTMDKITLVAWGCILILTSLVIVIGHRKGWFDDIWDSWKSIILFIVILVIGVSAIIFIPYAIIDLVGWHVSPVSKTIELLTRQIYEVSRWRK